MKLYPLTLSAMAILLLSACDAPPPPDDMDESLLEPSTEVAEEEGDEVELRWLPDGDDQRFAALEDQLAGFSAAMKEVNYRYGELHWAGEDRNWGYANYQLEKMADTIELGITRRPGRAESARPFLDTTIPALQEAIDAEDGGQFDERFEALTAHCNTCHGEEDVSFIGVAPPQARATAFVTPD